MAKKNIAILSLVGSILVIVGVFLPFFTLNLGFLGSINGSLLDFIKSSSTTTLSRIGAIAILACGVIALVKCFAGPAVLNLVSVICGIGGFVLLTIDAGSNLVKHFFDIAGVGFYAVLAGIICLIVAFATKK